MKVIQRPGLQSPRGSRLNNTRCAKTERLCLIRDIITYRCERPSDQQAKESGQKVRLPRIIQRMRPSVASSGSQRPTRRVSCFGRPLQTAVARRRARPQHPIGQIAADSTRICYPLSHQLATPERTYFFSRIMSS